ncbi:MAG: WG repeat-containing protein, partial [Bacteroidetes bacterium]|nr:WG repeat-containing protein [Bacteroidota bacterium]
LINAEGKVVIEPRFESVSSFSKGLARVKEGRKVGLINARGKVVIEPRFEQVYAFFNGLARVKEGGKLGFINTQGAMVMLPVHDEINTLGFRIYQLNQGTRVGFWTGSEYGTGIYDSTQAVRAVRFLPCDYEEIGATYMESYLRVKQNGKWGFVFWEPQPDGTDKAVLHIPCRYDAVTDFFEREGEMVARAYVAEFDLDFYINMKGEMLVNIVAEW